MTPRTRLPGGFIDVLFVLAAGALVANTLGIAFLSSQNWPTGGDSASHLLYTWLYADSLLVSGNVLPWLPEVFGGLPFLSYYFPLLFIVIALLSKLIGVAPAFKWGSFLAAMLLPGAIFVASRRWLGMTWTGALFAGLRAQAKARYLELAERYHGYWLPESLHTYALLQAQDGHPDQAAPFAARLREEYPGNKWTLKLDEAK